MISDILQYYNLKWYGTTEYQIFDRISGTNNENFILEIIKKEK